MVHRCAVLVVHACVPIVGGRHGRCEVPKARHKRRIQASQRVAKWTWAEVIDVRSDR